MKGPISIVHEGKLRLCLGSSLVPLLFFTVFICLPFVQSATVNIHRRIQFEQWERNAANQITSLSAENKNNDNDWMRSSVTQENGYNFRQKRELRSPRKIETSLSQMQKPTNYPFIMAEMVPGSVKTRHPSIIAINNCPAFYIADHEGKCKQVFQYTVNFGQDSPKYNPHSFHPNRSLFDSDNRFSNNFLIDVRNRPSFLSNRSRFGIFRQPSETSTEEPLSFTTATSLENSYIPPSTPSLPSPSLISPRLLAVLRTAAKKRLDFLAKSSTNSGESSDNSDFDKLRKRILEALKNTSDKDSLIGTKKSDKNWNKKDSDNTKVESEIKTTTVDYDD